MRWFVEMELLVEGFSGPPTTLEFLSREVAPQLRGGVDGRDKVFAIQLGIVTATPRVKFPQGSRKYHIPFAIST